ncbi:MAG: hypothetical protein J7M09_06780, partial [Deltaproteobacteria bacterium]|nr:hypothetical protein [Candidatus Tharpella sp.]
MAVDKNIFSHRLRGQKMIIFDQELESEAVLEVGHLMAAAARTAPKGKGADTIVTTLLTPAKKSQPPNRIKPIIIK